MQRFPEAGSSVHEKPGVGALRSSTHDCHVYASGGVRLLLFFGVPSVPGEPAQGPFGDFPLIEVRIGMKNEKLKDMNERRTREKAYDR